MGEQGSGGNDQEFEQGDLFEASKERVSPKDNALQDMADIFARRAEEARTEQDPDAPEPAQAIESSGTTHVGVEARAKGIVARGEQEAAEVNAVQSPAQLEGTGPVITPGSSAESARLARIARLAVADAAAKAQIEAEAPGKAAGIEVAQLGANQSRQVLDAIRQDKQLSAMNGPQESIAAEVASQETDVPDQGEPNQNKSEWPKSGLIESPQEAREIADKLAKGERPPFVE